MNSLPESLSVTDAAQRGYTHKNLLFWIGMLRSLVQPIQSTDHILDFGCGQGLFLQLLYEYFPFASATGIDFDADSIASAQRLATDRWPQRPVAYVEGNEACLSSYANSFDHIFAQEIFWMNRDISALAQWMYHAIKPGGRCYCTMGSHDRNPLWAHRRDQMLATGQECYTWSVEDVANAFHAAGFAVGARLLPCDGFLMYHPESTPKNAVSLLDLVQSTASAKILFYFGKHEPVRIARSLRG